MVSEGAWENRRVLVTGASGFIGSTLCHMLGALGAEVHGVSRGGRHGNGVHWWTADLAAPDGAVRVVEAVGPEVVFHLAGDVSGDRGLGAVVPALQGNLLTTVNVLTAVAGSNRCRVLLAGSMEETIPGDPEPVPGSPYAAAKTAASSYARLFDRLYELPLVNLRVFMVYGPGQRETKVVPYVVTSLLQGEAPRLTGGDREVDWVYVDDVVEAFVAAAGADGALGTTLDVGSGEEVTIRSVVERIAGLVGGAAGPVFGAVPDRPGERRRVADVARTRAAIGWEPSTPLDVGLARTVEWFRARSEQDQAKGHRWHRHLS